MDGEVALLAATLGVARAARDGACPAGATGRPSRELRLSAVMPWPEKWHRWQRNGCLATSSRSWFEPCGSWHDEAVLADRRVLVQERPALLGVALVAELVDRVAPGSSSAFDAVVRVVAARAAHLAFAHRVVRRAQRLGALRLVAREAGVRIGLVFSCAFSDLKPWTLWHDMQATLRRACMLLGKLAWLPFSWQVRQVALISLALLFFREGTGPWSRQPSGSSRARPRSCGRSRSSG